MDFPQLPLVLNHLRERASADRLRTTPKWLWLKSRALFAVFAGNAI
jgi:hypothetical protein